MDVLVLDCETLPTADPAVIAEITANIKPPGNISKAETIAKWEAEEKPAKIKEAIAKTALSGEYGSICSIGWALNNDEPYHASQNREWNELNILLSFKEYMESIDHSFIKVVGHNLCAFDLPFIRQRMLINGIGLPKNIPWYARPWDERIGDTMLLWDSSPDKRISLDRLCKALGVPSPKNGIDGSMISELFSQGRFNEIAAYCRADVVATRACYRRMTI
jgi:hypothetical protein